MGFRGDVPGGPAVCRVQKLTTNRGRSIALGPVPHKKGGTFGCPSCAGRLAWKLPLRWRSRSRTGSVSESVGPASALRRRPSSKRKGLTTARIIVETTGAAAKPQAATTMIKRPGRAFDQTGRKSRDHFPEWFVIQVVSLPTSPSKCKPFGSRRNSRISTRVDRRRRNV